MRTTASALSFSCEREHTSRFPPKSLNAASAPPVSIMTGLPWESVEDGNVSKSEMAKARTDCLPEGLLCRKPGRKGKDACLPAGKGGCQLLRMEEPLVEALDPSPPADAFHVHNVDSHPEDHLLNLLSRRRRKIHNRFPRRPVQDGKSRWRLWPRVKSILPCPVNG